MIGIQTPTPVRAGDMPDIDSVYNVVEHIDELRDYGWNRQLKKKLSDGFGS